MPNGFGRTGGVPPLTGIKSLSEKRMADENKHLKNMGKCFGFLIFVYLVFKLSSKMKEY